MEYRILNFESSISVFDQVYHDPVFVFPLSCSILSAFPIKKYYVASFLLVISPCNIPLPYHQQLIVCVVTSYRIVLYRIVFRLFLSESAYP